MLASSYISPKAVKGQPSTIQGRGLVAVSPISKDEIVAIKGGHVVDTATRWSRGFTGVRRELTPVIKILDVIPAFGQARAWRVGHALGRCQAGSGAQISACAG